MPRGASSKGWTITEFGGKGKGKRWYRNCGCLPWREYSDSAEHLWRNGMDYPAWRMGRVALARAARVEENPFPNGSDEAWEWLSGWVSALARAEEKSMTPCLYCGYRQVPEGEEAQAAEIRRLKLLVAALRKENADWADKCVCAG